MTKLARVVITGADAPAWLTALGILRVAGRAGIQVTVVEAPSALTAADVHIALPTLTNLHRLLGLDPDRVLAACGGAYVLGQRFANWSRAAPPFMHAYDTHGTRLNETDFIHYWLRARAEGMNVAIEDFSLGAAAAKQGRYVLSTESTRRFSKAAFGQHLEAGAYAAVLRERATRQGVALIPGSVREVRVVEGRITGLVLADGQTIEADLYIDATGAQGSLISRLPDSGAQSWAQWLPCDRMIVASGKRLDPLPAFSEIAAHNEGWLGLYPLMNRTAIVCMYKAQGATDRDMLEQMAVLSGLQIEGEAVSAPFEARMRPRPWIGNCVAIGDAAACLEPLDAAHMQVLQIGLTHLLAMFPIDSGQMPEAAAYNRIVTAHYENVRDFQIAHYKLNRRLDARFWDRLREIDAPPSLAYKLALFERCAQIAIYDHETFQEENWLANFIGHGLIPKSYDARADALEGEALMAQFQQMLRFIAAEVTDMPSLEAHMETHAPQPSTGLF